MSSMIIFFFLGISMVSNLGMLIYYVKGKKNKLKKTAIMCHYCFLEICVCLKTPDIIIIIAMGLGAALLIEDLEYMEISVWKIILFCGVSIVALIINFSMWTLMAAALYSLGLIALRYKYDGMLGSADIIYIAGSTCIIGAIPAVYAVCIACVLSILMQLPSLKKKERTPIPFLPGLCTGFGYAILFIPFIPK